MHLRPTGLAPHWCVAGGGLAAGHWAAEGRAATGQPAGGTAQPCRGHHVAGTAETPLAWGRVLPRGPAAEQQAWYTGARGWAGPGQGASTQSRMAVSLDIPLDVPLDIPTTQVSAFDVLAVPLGPRHLSQALQPRPPQGGAWSSVSGQFYT